MPPPVRIQHALPPPASPALSLYTKAMALTPPPPHHPPPQIYDRIHDVSPLIVRLGLDEYAGIFEDQQINFDSFLTLEAQDLIDIGVDSFGARRRIMRAVHELRLLAINPVSKP